MGRDKKKKGPQWQLAELRFRFLDDKGLRAPLWPNRLSRVLILASPDPLFSAP